MNWTDEEVEGWVAGILEEALESASVYDEAVKMIDHLRALGTEGRLEDLEAEIKAALREVTNG